MIEDAIAQYQKERFWQDVEASVERLRADPIAWREYREEIAFFEGGSMDGLEHEERYFSLEEVEEIGAEHGRTQSG